MSVIHAEEDVDDTATRDPLLPRLYTDTQGSRSLPAHLRPYGPLWEPPSFVHPVHCGDDGWQIERGQFGLNPIMRARMQAAEADLLYGPVMDLVCDVGWFKGKWDMAQRTENPRWGGLPYLPQQLKVPPAIKPENQSEPISKVIPSSAPSLLIDSPGRNGRGSLDLYAGPLRVKDIVEEKEETKQDKFRFELFAGTLLNQLVPGKRGIIFNAGGPVWSLDFLPGVDCRKVGWMENCQPSTSRAHRGPHLDYIAISTISEDPGLIPPSEMRKRGIATKGSVQIWSIPLIEPQILGCPARPGRWSSGTAKNAKANTPKSTPTESLQQEVLQAVSKSTIEDIAGSANGIDRNPIPQLDFFAPGPKSVENGVFAVALVDGSVAIYAPPDPTIAASGLLRESPKKPSSEADVLLLDIKPRAQLLLPDTTCLTLEWANHDVIAGGCTNGYIVIWNVLDALTSVASASTDHSTTPFDPIKIRPTHYVSLHAAPVRSLEWIRTPPLNRKGEPETDQDPSFLASTGYDGSLKLIDTEDIASSATLIHERGETTSLAFSPTLGSLHLADSGLQDLGVSKKILIQLGLLWQLATSDLHSFIAYAGADGVCGLASMIRPQKYKSRATMWAPKVYQFDFSRNTGELRMLDNIKPDVGRHTSGANQDFLLHVQMMVPRWSMKSSLKPKSNKAKDSSRKGGKPRTGQVAQTNSPVGIWPPIVAVHCVSWCPSIRRATILASGTGCGLVRVDAVEGGWHGKGMRFGGIDELVDGAADPNNQAACKEEEDEYMD
ncbi:hypothetical protein DFH28DRAFT_1121041 [Melampsora americana]|nr:hypothetical protein DFH28DRAFT_1121041 [Melampsora americana]